MAIIVFNEKNLTINIRCQVGETFTPNAELQDLANELDMIREEYKLFNVKMSNFLTKCNRWNEKHDSAFAKAVEIQRQQQKKELEKKESSQEKSLLDVKEA